MKRVLAIMAVLALVASAPVGYSADFNGDGTNDIAIFRPSTGLWAIRGGARTYFGRSGDEPMPGDYDGDGTVDIAIFRESNGLWAVDGGLREYWGGVGDVPIPGIPASGGGGPWSQIGSSIYYDYDDGIVAIGSTAPAYAGLCVYYNSAVDYPQLRLGELENDYVRVNFQNSGTSDYFTLAAKPQEITANARMHLYYNQTGNIMTCTGDGKVGIGISDPRFSLDIHKDSSSYSYLRFTNATTGTGASDGVLIGLDPNEDFRIHSYEDNDIEFYTNGTEKATIKNDGDVGIGTDSPNAKLHISGSTSQTGLIVRAGDVSGYTENIVELYDGAGTLRYEFEGAGRALADNGWVTFSPYISMHFIPEGSKIDDYGVGDVVSAINKMAVKTNGAFDRAVVGVICPSEGFISIPKELKQAITKEGKKVDDFTLVPVAYEGDVQVKVNDEGGTIKSGDLIVPSSVPGVAMKGQPESFEQYASVIGKAREDFEEDQGLVWVSVGVK